MMRYAKWSSFLVLAGLLAAGCGKEEAAAPGSGASADGAKYLLTAEPAGAKGVLETRKEAKDGDEVVLVGRIGGSKKPWVEGRAGFWIVDASFKACNEKADDDCTTPWDYCCDPPEELAKAKATVKVVDDNGQTVPVDARQLLGVKELNTVVVKGRAKRDDKGNLTILASGLFVRS